MEFSSVLKYRFLFLAAVSLAFCSCDANKKVKLIEHPKTGEKLTIISLGGISDDYTYVVQGQSDGEIPEAENFVSFHDSFGITFSDTAWTIYYLGSVDKKHRPERMNINFRNLSKPEYRNFIDTTEAEFLHTYYF